MPTTRPVTLTEEERAQVQTFVHRGKANARTLVRAHVLLKAAEGWTDRDIAAAFDVCTETVRLVRKRFAEAPPTARVDAVLQDKRQARRRAALAGGQVAHLIAIACSPAPDGHDHWTLRLLAGKAVELGYVARISPETIRAALKKTS